MDADILRIILAVLGALVIAGLYYWEQRRRHRNEEVEEEALARPELDDEAWRFKTDYDQPEGKREPNLGVWGRDEGDLEAEGEEGIGGDTRPRGRSERTLFKFFKPDPDLREESFPPGPMLLVLHVAARGSHFDGASIVHAARIAGLEPGDHDIFHCKLGDEHHTETLFSMANMVKPGTFPFGAMAEFETPGLTLFAQLDGQAGDPGRLEELLGTAHSLANDLDGELRDDQRQPLTTEGEEGLRQRVMAFITQRMAD